MEIKSVCHIYFSPTKTSRKIAHAVSKYFPDIFKRDIDLTQNCPKQQIINRDELAIITVPVYGGHIAPTATYRLQNLTGDNTPAIIIAVYGNRSYGNSLAELNVWCNQHGFIPVTAATFIGEHSYNSKLYPIADGRPDIKDIEIAAQMGQKIFSSLQTCLSINDIQPINPDKLKSPTNDFAMFRFFTAIIIALKIKHIPVPPTPDTDTEKCTKCGACSNVCPTGAINIKKPSFSNPKLCIRCCACVKSCPQTARSYPTPFAPILSRTMKKRKEPLFFQAEINKNQ